LWRVISNKPHHLDEKVRRSTVAEVRIPVSSPGTGGPILRMNGLLVRQLPAECQSISLKRTVDWYELKRIQGESERAILVTKADTICVWGQKQDIKSSFGADLLKVDVRRIPSDLTASESFPFKAFLEEALAIGLARGKPLLVRTKSRATYLIVDAHSDDGATLAPLTREVQRASGSLPGLFSPVSEDYPTASKLSWSECLRVSLDQRGDQTWLSLTPDIWIWPQHAREAARTFLDKRKGGRFNKQHNAILDAWLKILLGDGHPSGDIVVNTFDGKNGPENPTFILSRRTAFSRKIQG